MGLFDALQDIVTGATENLQGPLQDIAGTVTDNQLVQDVQEQVTAVSENASDAVASGTETVQNTVDDVMNTLGL